LIHLEFESFASLISVDVFDNGTLISLRSLTYKYNSSHIAIYCIHFHANLIVQVGLYLFGRKNVYIRYEEG